MKDFLIFSFYLILFIQFIQVENYENIIMNLYYSTETGKFTAVKSDKVYDEAIANGIYNKSFEAIGWDYLSITTYDKKDNKYDDKKKAYALGYLEGILTRDRIWGFHRSLKFNLNYKDDTGMKQFIIQNLKYMNETSSQKMEKEAYWEHVQYIFQQVMGLYDGYVSVAEKGKEISFEDFAVMFSYLDSLDTKYYNKTNVIFRERTTEEIRRDSFLNSHCSGLIKLVPGFSDLFFGHCTWDTYCQMFKIIKEYRFTTKKANEKSKLTVFTSYPGVISSGDDFYYLDSNLLVMETSFVCPNKEIFRYVNPKTLLTCFRTVLSNRLAGSAKEWVETFKKENSGTYNNQFSILDLNKVDLDKKEIKSEALMIIEQMPNDTAIVDKTNDLRDSYWPSYNSPSVEKIYNGTGFAAAVKKDPNLTIDISYKECARAKIFKREQQRIKKLDDFKDVIRFNDYQKDEHSKKDPRYTIACRNDLVPGTHSCSGATDGKVASVRDLIKERKMHFIASPTNVRQPTFSWTNATCIEKINLKFDSQYLPQTWNYKWIEYKIRLENLQKVPGKDDIKKEEQGQVVPKQQSEGGNKKTLIIVLSVVGGIVLLAIIGLIVFLVFFKKKKEELKDNVFNISYTNKDNRLTEGEDEDEILT